MKYTFRIVSFLEGVSYLLLLFVARLLHKPVMLRPCCKKHNRGVREQTARRIRHAFRCLRQPRMPTRWELPCQPSHRQIRPAQNRMLWRLSEWRWFLRARSLRQRTRNSAKSWWAKAPPPLRGEHPRALRVVPTGMQNSVCGRVQSQGFTQMFSPLAPAPQALQEQVLFEGDRTSHILRRQPSGPLPWANGANIPANASTCHTLANHK